ncbi:hypothetical protein ACFWXH_29785 [Mesorhizobium sp. NPDC059054]|uniref:hypothetical protein n=1 Tax=Mesorhizobium sp. NPDC059054 TaxID=3346711 RepID=UPI00369477E5
MPIRQTDLQQTEALLHEMLAEATAAEQRARPKNRLLSRLSNPLRGLGRKRTSAGKSTKADSAEQGICSVDALAELFAPPDITPEPKAHLPNLSRRPARTAGTDSLGNRPLHASEPFQRMKKDTRRSDFVMAASGVMLGLVCALFPWYIFFNPEQFGVQGIKFGGRGQNAGRLVVAPDGSGTNPMAGQAEALEPNLDMSFTATLQSRPLAPEQAPGVEEQPYPIEAVAFRLVHIANGRAMIEDNAGLWVVQAGSTLPDSSRVKSIEQRAGKWVLVTNTDRVLEISN